jgi:hypothetical protein
MEALVNFFALRPTFTFLGLRVVWYIYLHARTDLHCGVYDFSSIGTEGHKLGSLVAELYSFDPWPSCPTCSGADIP